MKRFFITIMMAAVALNAASAQDKVLWGGPGSKDGEFDGGLNGWTTVGLQSGDDAKKSLCLFTWDANASAPGGYNSIANATLNSASKNNGAAVFNSDVLDSGTGANKKPTGGGSFGSGICPIPHESELISPLINVKNNKDITLVFSQLFANFQSGRPRDSQKPNASTVVMYSRDGGVTWSEPIAIYPNEQCKTYQVNTSYSPTVITRVQLPGAGGTDKFKIKFSFDGDYYFWIVDDVAIVAMENNNLRANLNFYAPYENASVPITQTRESYFLNDIQNLGAKKQTNVRHTMSIYKLNATGQLVQPAVYRDTLKYGTVDIDTTIENISFPKGFAPTGSKVNYAGIYDLLSDSTDIEPWNNRASFLFDVTDSTFAKDRGRTRSVAPAFASGAAPIFGYGNVFYIKNGKNFKSGTMTFGLESGANNVGESIDAYLYEWSGDANTNNEIDEDELLTLGYATYKIKGTEAAPTTAKPNQNLVRLSLDNFNNAGKPITLKDNTFYVAYVEHSAKTVDDPMFLSAFDRYNYSATDLAFAGLKKQSFHNLIKIGDTPIRTGGFSSMVPTIRWNIKTIVDAKEPLLAANVVSVSPNPASEYLNVAFNFEATAKSVVVNVLDINGREVLNADFNNIQKETFNLDVTSLSAGIYNLMVRTENGVTTKSFIIQK
jgi:hypothetical protein